MTGFEAVKTMHNDLIVAGLSGDEENTAQETSTLNAKDIRRSENTAEVLMNMLNKIKEFSFTI